MSTETEQPVVGGGCISCGVRPPALPWRMCQPCIDRDCDEREARTRALDSSALLGGALRWIAEPTRAGWWVWWDFHQAAPELYLIKIEDTPLTKGAFYYHPGRQRWESCGFKNWRAMGVRGGWAGPVERPQVPDEQAPPNEPSSATAGRAGGNV